MGLQSTSMRRGISSTAIIGSIIFVIGSLLWVLLGRTGVDNGQQVFSSELYEVTRGSFDISVPTSGELAAQNQINIHNLLESNAVVMELVDEGIQVSEGDVLMRLNDDSK